MSQDFERSEYIQRPIDDVHNDPATLVERMYRQQYGVEGPFDATSHYNMEQYLESRLTPQEVHVSTGVVSIAHTEMTAVPGQLRRDGWLLRPRDAGLITVAGLLAINAVANVANLDTSMRDLGDELQQFTYDISQLFAAPEQPQIVVQTPTETLVFEKIDANGSTLSASGEVQVNPADISGFLDKVETSIDGGAEMLSLAITGSASDEIDGQWTLGAPDALNQTLSQGRADAGWQELNKQAQERGLVLPEPTITAAEDILAPDVKTQLDALAQQAGYENGFAAIVAHDNGEPMDETLASYIYAKVTAERNYIIAAEMQLALPPPPPPEIEQPRPEVSPERPDNPEREYDWTFLPFLVPPIPRLRRETLLEPRTVITEVPVDFEHQTWVKVYPESLERAKDQDGIFRDHLVGPFSWAATRKGDHLLRDERIQHVLRAEYQNEDGDEKALRVMFVDHRPTAATVTAFQALLEDASLMQDGGLADKFTAIMVFPSENAGLAHQDPKRIGLGVDKQDEGYVLGITMPLLKLIEMHMPTEPTVKYLESFNGAVRTFAHELHGHGTDVIDDRIILDQVVGQTTDSLGGFVSRSAWRGVAGAEIANHISLNNRDKEQQPLTFVDTAGVEISEVDTDTLAGTNLVRLSNGRPTKYGDDQGEGYAEAAAALVTGAPIPFAQADLAIDGGYRISEQLEQAVQQNVGAHVVPFALEFATEPKVIFYEGSVASDPGLEKVIAHAKATPVPRPDQMYDILTGFTN